MVFASPSVPGARPWNSSEARVRIMADIRAGSIVGIVGDVDKQPERSAAAAREESETNDLMRTCYSRRVPYGATHGAKHGGNEELPRRGAAGARAADVDHLGGGPGLAGHDRSRSHSPHVLWSGGHRHGAVPS